MVATKEKRKLLKKEKRSFSLRMNDQDWKKLQTLINRESLRRGSYVSKNWLMLQLLRTEYERQRSKRGRA